MSAVDSNERLLLCHKVGFWMDAGSVSEALAQILENYQRCGLRHVPQQSLSDDLQAYVNSVHGDAAAAESVANSVAVEPVANSAATNAEVQHGVLSGNAGSKGNAGPNATPATLAASRSATSNSSSNAATPAIPAQPSAWSLPVLDVAERATRLEEVNQQVRGCRECRNIVDFRHQTVFGDGTLQPTICFMGEAPGADEDRQGKPFVGKAGQLLTRIISAMKLEREEVYILNALKCRPPQNRTPVPDEIDNCRGYVETQLEILQPKYIVCLGAVAVRSILQSNLSIGRLRGQFHDYRGAKVVVTYHPSYLLRNESAKRLVWEDMKMLMRELGVQL